MLAVKTVAQSVLMVIVSEGFEKYCLYRGVHEIIQELLHEFEDSDNRHDNIQ